MTGEGARLRAGDLRAARAVLDLVEQRSGRLGDLADTTADLRAVARRSVSDLRAALRSAGERAIPVVAVGAVPPFRGVDELLGTLDAHRADLDPADVGAGPAGAGVACLAGSLGERAGAR